MTSDNLLVELLVQELPPKSLPALSQAFADALYGQLRALGLAGAASSVTAYATPRRLAVHISAVADRAADRLLRDKLMPVSVALDAGGNATPALRKRLQALGADTSSPLATAATVAALERAPDGKTEALFYNHSAAGVTLLAGLQQALDQAISRLPAARLMRYQLERGCALPGWSSVQFVRPAQSLLALHGARALAVTALGLLAGDSTEGHRFEAARKPLRIAHADAYADTLREHGAVLASFAERRAEIVRQLAAAAALLGAGVRPVDDAALLDEVTALVERPRVLICQFDARFLRMPQDCLILTMKAQQKYFPLLDAAGALTPRFLVVSNISPADPALVTGGNERVVHARLADAQFFFDQDRKKPLAACVDELARVLYHNQLGTQRERVERVRAIAAAIAATLAPALADPGLPARVDQAALLAKADLVSAMVGEFPELQGSMGRHYALAEGIDAQVADAIEDHYKPRFAGDSLARSPTGVALALADKIETLTGLFGSGNRPTGERDPFALRRQALGLVRMLAEKQLPLELDALLAAGQAAFGDRIADVRAQLADFIYERLAGSLREQGYSAQEVDAVLALRPQRLALVARQLAAVRAFAALPESPALAAANKRIANILKKAGAVDAHVSPALLHERAEIDLYAALRRFVPEADALFDAGDYTASLQTLAVLRAPVDAFLTT